MADSQAVALPAVATPNAHASSARSLAVLGLVVLTTARAALIMSRWATLGHQATRLELIALVLGAGYLFVRPHPRAPASLTVALLGLIAVDAFDILWQQLPLGVLYVGVSLYLRYFLLTFIVYALAVDDADMEAVLKVLAPVFIGLSLLTIVQFATGHGEQFFLNPNLPTPIRAGIRQSVGIFDWPDGWAFFCGTWFFIYLARRTQSSLYSVTSILLALAVGATLTRWCIVALLALLILYLLKRRRTRWRAAALVVIIAVLAAIYVGQIKSQFGTDLRYYSSGEAPRVAYLREGVRIFLSKPLYTLTGVGYNRFGRAAPYAIDDPRTNPINGNLTILSSTGQVAMLSTTDSLVASLLPEFGVVGLLLLLGFFVVVLRQGTQWARNNPAARGYVYGMVFVLLCSLTDSSGFFAPHAAVFWVAAGLILVASQRESRVSAAPSPRRWS